MTSKLVQLLENIKTNPEVGIVFRNDYLLGRQDRVFLYVAPKDGIYSISGLNEFQDSVIGEVKPSIKIKFRKDILKNFYSGIGFFEGLKKGLRPGSASFDENLDIMVQEKIQTNYILKSNDSHFGSERLSKVYSGEINKDEVTFTTSEENLYDLNSKDPFFTRLIHLDFSPNKEIIQESIKKWTDSGGKEKGYNLDLPWAIRFSDLPGIEK